ncbi:DUF732 domain-containing protein, partial [Geodermatophilus sp. SYSU D01186]
VARLLAVDGGGLEADEGRDREHDADAGCAGEELRRRERPDVCSGSTLTPRCVVGSDEYETAEQKRNAWVQWTRGEAPFLAALGRDDLLRYAESGEEAAELGVLVCTYITAGESAQASDLLAASGFEATDAALFVGAAASKMCSG